MRRRRGRRRPGAVRGSGAPCAARRPRLSLAIVAKASSRRACVARSRSSASRSNAFERASPTGCSSAVTAPRVTPPRFRQRQRPAIELKPERDACGAHGEAERQPVAVHRGWRRAMPAGGDTSCPPRRAAGLPAPPRGSSPPSATCTRSSCDAPTRMRWHASTLPASAPAVDSADNGSAHIRRVTLYCTSDAPDCGARRRAAAHASSAARQLRRPWRSSQRRCSRPPARRRARRRLRAAASSRAAAVRRPRT